MFGLSTEMCFYSGFAPAREAGLVTKVLFLELAAETRKAEEQVERLRS
jgi:hypothetical protein